MVIQPDSARFPPFRTGSLLGPWGSNHFHHQMPPGMIDIDDPRYIKVRGMSAGRCGRDGKSQGRPQLNHPKLSKTILVAGLVAFFFYLCIYWVAHHPNWRTHIFQRGWNQPPTRYCFHLWPHLRLVEVGNLWRLDETEKLDPQLDSGFDRGSVGPMLADGPARPSCARPAGNHLEELASFEMIKTGLLTVHTGWGASSLAKWVYNCLNNREFETPLF